MRYGPVESGIDGTSRRDMAAGPFLGSAAQRGIWSAEQVVGSAPIAMARYIEIVGDLNLDVPAEVGRRAGREFGTGYPSLIEIAPQCPTQVVTAVSAYRPAGESTHNDLMFFTAARKRDGSAGHDPVRAAPLLGPARQRQDLPPCARDHPRRDDRPRGAAGDLRGTGVARRGRPATVGCDMLRSASSPPTGTGDAQDGSVQMSERSERIMCQRAMRMTEPSASEARS